MIIHLLEPEVQPYTADYCLGIQVGLFGSLFR